MQPWFKLVKPHKDIQDGHLDESIFAANLAEVASGTGREIYTSPDMFFQKTFSLTTVPFYLFFYTKILCNIPFEKRIL